MINRETSLIEETLEILKHGYYIKNNKKIKLKLSKDEMKLSRVYLPNEIEAFLAEPTEGKTHSFGNCVFSCENIDSFSMALKIKNLSDTLEEYEKNEILVLNFANPVNPGGGVRRGAKAQEEDLCRSSSLLLSLESRAAEKYYDYNKSLLSYLGSDAIIISPKVEIIRNVNGELLDNSVVVAVITCAAPMITHGLEGLTYSQYEELFYNRIVGMLACAARMGYKHLVLGAFGCGAFGNDAKLVSDLFYNALHNSKIDGLHTKNYFRRIDFAVLDKSCNQYNYNEFYRSFGADNFYRKEMAADRLY